ncbi:MAG: PHP-associated domain-containing protein [Myxococcota bacterium]
MILDLHSHSVRSDDGRAQVENYCQWVRRRALPIDGFVLTEHRQFDFESDYSALAREHSLTILKASEVETDYGHVLVFGVTPALVAAFEFASVRLPLVQVLESAARHGAVAVPCHPGRPRVGMCAHVTERGPVEGVRIVEVYNGGSRSGEDDAARALAERFGYQGIGGSDAHIVSHIGRCATRFPARVDSEAELAEALRAGEFEAVSWKSKS